MMWPFKRKQDKGEKEYLERLYKCCGIGINVIMPETPKVKHKGVQEFFKRIAELEGAMDNLLRDHPVGQDMSDFYFFINSYTKCAQLWEDRYCRDYLKKRVYAGYKRYDDERL